ncbi:hypothetical protein [Streptomyces sp. NPDC002640]
MRRPVTGDVFVAYGQIYVQSDPDDTDMDLAEAFAGQTAGLCGAAVPGALWLTTGTHTGKVGFTVEVHEQPPPPPDPAWEDVVEVSFRPVSDRTLLVQWAGEAAWDLGLARADHRVRYCARGMDRGSGRDTGPGAEPETERYLLQFWPAPPGPDRVLRATSRQAAHWHRYARDLPPPPTPQERAERELLAQQAAERAAKERQLDLERWEWGGRPPSARPRTEGGAARPLLRFDSDLVHTLDTLEPEAQRATALLAARRACETADLTEVPWVGEALTALTRGQPLPPPFHDPDRLRRTLTSDPRVPHRPASPAEPPEWPPYRPATDGHGVTWIPAARLGEARTTRPGLGRRLGAFVPNGPAASAAHAAHAAHALNEPVVVGPGADGPKTTGRVSQQHLAVRAVLAAADADPLRAALGAVWHAVHAYGEHHPDLLAEIRAACARHRGA